MKTFQKPLTPEEERCYLRILREADEIQAGKAKEVLIERNLRLVAHIAKKYQNSGEDMDDLISIGCIGLIKAVDTFDRKKGRLATYACINYNEAYAPEEIADRSIVINGDAGEIISRLLDDK